MDDRKFELFTTVVALGYLLEECGVKSSEIVSPEEAVLIESVGEEYGLLAGKVEDVKRIFRNNLTQLQEVAITDEIQTKE